MTFGSARELFEAARDASLDAAKVTAELDALDEQAARIGSPSLDPRGRGTRGGDAIGRRVAHIIDRQESLERRLGEDYDLIDAACAVLYGSDGISDGLATLAPPWWADAIYHHYVGLRTWDGTAALVLYSKRYVQECVRTAFEIMDANGMAATVAGIGSAT